MLKLRPLHQRGPLRVMFVITSMPIGGAETLLVEIVRRMDRRRFEPEICCLKKPGPLGELMAREVPLHTGIITDKYDPLILWRVFCMMRRRKPDAVITVGTGGDKMFWGRLGGWLAGVPVICSALHSTGLPDHVEWINRMLTPITDAFIGCAEPHGRYLAEHEGCPQARVRVIPNGVDTERFHPGDPPRTLREELGIEPTSPVIGIVAALRPEKNHELFVETAARVVKDRPNAKFLIVGDGERGRDIRRKIDELGLTESVLMLGSRSDVPELLRLMDVFLLTSHMEANPVSIMEAMACGAPVIAPRVGSIPETVHDDVTGYLIEPRKQASMAEGMAACVKHLIDSPEDAKRIGGAGRQLIVDQWSVECMVRGYEDLVADIYTAKATSLSLAGLGWLRRWAIRFPRVKAPGI